MTVVLSGVESDAALRSLALEVEAVSHNVDGVLIDDFSLKIGKGKIAGLIGVKEAVKTTALKLLTGQLRPTTGCIRLAGQDVTHVLPDARGLLGLACCCQGKTCHGMKIFSDLTALENVALGAYGKQTPFFPRHGGKSVEEQALALLDDVGLAADANRLAEDLPLTQKRLLSIAVALAGGPSVIIIDHAGYDLPFHDYMHLANLIDRIREKGTAILLASCRYGPLMKLCDHVTVLAGGQIVTKNSSAQIVYHPYATEAPYGSLQ